MSRRNDPLALLFRDGAPVSYLLIALFAGSFLLFFLASGGGGLPKLVDSLAWRSDLAGARPWTVLTYAFVNPQPLSAFFECVAVYFFLVPLERSWRSRKTAAFFLAATAAASVFAWIGAAILGVTFGIASAALPVTAAIVAWASRNPGATILLFAVIPLRAAWVAWIAAVLAVASSAYGTPLMAPFVAMPLVLAWAYASGRLAIPEARRAGRPRMREGDYAGTDWEKRRQAESERRRLKDLFERSWSDDDPRNEK